MKKVVLSLCFLSLVHFSLPINADADVDFSKAYVIPEKSTVDKVTIGGIKPLWNDLFYKVDFALSPEYNMNIVGILEQHSLPEQLEQSLRNTTWVGTYLVGKSFSTTLKLVVVQDGYVGGEVIHSEPESKGGSYLHARVTGDILTQYQINGSYIDEDSLSSETLNALPVDTVTRQLIRIKRGRALQFKDGNDGSKWSTNREYRMILENSMLSGSVGVPDVYGSGDATSESGSIQLALQKANSSGYPPGDGESNGQLPERFIHIIEINDPRSSLGAITYDQDKNLFIYYGGKSKQGTLLSVDRVEFHHYASGENMFMDLDINHFPRKVGFSTGEYIEFSHDKENRQLHAQAYEAAIPAHHEN